MCVSVYSHSMHWQYSEMSELQENYIPDCQSSFVATVECELCPSETAAVYDQFSH